MCVSVCLYVCVHVCMHVSVCMLVCVVTYFEADFNTNACPPFYSKIVSAVACAGAAGVLGRSYFRSWTDADAPSGCHIANGGGVWFNDHPTGAPKSNMQPLCAAGTPANLNRSVPVPQCVRA